MSSVLTRDEVRELLARMMRDEEYPDFWLAPPPEWAYRAAEKVIDYHAATLASHLGTENWRRGIQHAQSMHHAGDRECGIAGCPLNYPGAAADVEPEEPRRG